MLNIYSNLLTQLFNLAFVFVVAVLIVRILRRINVSPYFEITRSLKRKGFLIQMLLSLVICIVLLVSNAFLYHQQLAVGNISNWQALIFLNIALSIVYAVIVINAIERRANMKGFPALAKYLMLAVLFLSGGGNILFWLTIVALGMLPDNTSRYH